ncbi:MAG TPA: Arc family DNA-binding protein [Geminicoccaceae bacterium]
MPASGYMMAMATLSIRKLPDEVHRRLRMRAAEHGRSMEAEARAILEAAVAKPGHDAPDGAPPAIHRLQTYVDQFYGESKPANVVDEFLVERRQEAAREQSE